MPPTKIRRYDIERMFNWTLPEITDELNSLRLENGRLRAKNAQLLGQRNALRIKMKRIRKIAWSFGKRVR